VYIGLKTNSTYNTANIFSPKNINTNLKFVYLKCQGEENSNVFIPAFDRRKCTSNEWAQ